MLTYWPRFSISNNDSGNEVEVRDISTLRPAPSTECRGGSCCDSQMGWGPHICKVLPGRITTEIKTHIGEHNYDIYVKLRSLTSPYGKLHEIALQYATLH